MSVYKKRYIARLTKETEFIFGRPVLTDRDCIHLSDEIFVKVGHRISKNTLRRFFGLISTDHLASVSTMSILSKYCGFTSLSAVPAETDSKEEAVNEVGKDNVLRYLCSLFQIDAKSENDETYLSVMLHTVNFIKHNPQLAYELQRQIAKTEMGRKVYFEKFVQMDALNSFYGDGLRYYLSAGTTVENELFAHSLLVVRYWLTNETEKLLLHYDHLSQLAINHEEVSPWLCARYLASSLYYTETTEKGVEAIVKNARAIHKNLQRDNEYNLSFPYFEYTLSEALVLTGHYNEALYYIDHALLNHMNIIEKTAAGFLQSLLLFKAIAECKAGSVSEAVKIFNQITMSKFYSLSKKFTSILYLSLGNVLNGKNQMTALQANSIIKETGFIKLNKFMPSVAYDSII